MEYAGVGTWEQHKWGLIVGLHTMTIIESVPYKRAIVVEPPAVS